MDSRFFSPGSITALPTLGALRAAAAPIDPTVPLHDPTLEPRDEAVFLLTAAAEIEHALMVQYLYAAYSVRVVNGDPNQEKLEEVQELIIQIAREEMGHLATVQNLLHLVGGPLNFNREHSPYASEIYPFRFTLEPLTLDSLSKYVTAESPAELPPDMSQEERELVEQIHRDADQANGGQEVRHVGPIFARLEHLFAEGLADADLRLDTFDLHAKFSDWGFEPRNADAGEPLIVVSFPDTEVGLVREAAVAAVRAIGAQGEGFDSGPAGTESHFERFFDIYQRVSTLSSAGAVITWPVATNPNTTPVPSTSHSAPNEVAAALEAHASTGRITHPRARAWAHLFNLRYRLLLGQLGHFLRLDQALYSDAPGPQLGDRTARGLLLIGTFDEMRHLKKIAGKLAQLPKDNPPGPVHAGPTFELPYTLNLPDGEPQRWRMHLDASRAAVRIIEELRQSETDGFLDDLLAGDGKAQVVMQSLAQGNGIPPESLPTGFGKAVRILEEAVRGFTVNGRVHDNFWAEKTRDQFINEARPRPVQLNPDGSVVRDPNTAPLVQRLEGTAPGNRMPRFRPPVPAARIGFIRQWITEGCPDDSPPGQVGVDHERNPAPEALITPDPQPTSLSFESDIKVLFRTNPDRSSMLFKFDLHRYEDVRDHATDILARLEEGTMPCDGGWPPERIATFRQWIADGKQP
ncbi:MAG TPA: ferritin-like domain-containing protein [Pseudonocardiaceae bacterium]|nr:ferritin-like domain-containing protein [Pseudonocardiaceae bacterium]